MDKNNNVSEKGQIVMASLESPKVWGVPGLKRSVSTKSGSWKEPWRSSDRVMGGKDTLMHVGSEASLYAVCCIGQCSAGKPWFMPSMWILLSSGQHKGDQRNVRLVVII